MLFLKEDTEVAVRVGPFLAPADGYTAYTTAAPTVYLSKAHGAFAARNGSTWTHDRDGWYACQLTTTDTSTPGTLVLSCAGSSNFLPVWQEFTVVHANVFDSLFGAAGADLLDVNAAQLGGTTQTGRDIGTSVLLSSGTGTGQISLSSGAVTVGTINANAVNAAAIATGAIDADAIADNAIDAGAIADGSLTAIKFADDFLTAAKIANGAIDANTFAAGAINAAAIATGAIDADALAADAGTEIGTAVWATTTRALTDKVDFGLSTSERSSVADAVLDEAMTEPAATFTWASATLRTVVAWIGALSRNKVTQTSTTQTLRNDADNADISTSTVSDAAGTTTRGEWT